MAAGRKTKKRESSGPVGILAGASEGAAVEKLLRKQGVASVAMDATELARAAENGELSAAVIAEDQLSPADAALIDRAIDSQPHWADLPIVLIVDRDTMGVGANLSRSGQLRIVERPLHPAILESSLRSAIRSRSHQHQGRDFREQARAAEEHHRKLTESLEANVAVQISDLRGLSERLTEEIEERKRTEELLRESEEMYRRTVELSNQIAWTSDADGNKAVINRKFYEMTGTSEDIPFPLLLPQLVHPDDYAPSMVRWRDALESGQLPGDEVRMRVADGSYRTFAARAVPRRDESGTIVRWYGFIEDITEQKDAMVALEQAEERYRLAARATNDAIWDWNIATGRLAWSDAAVAYFGRGPIEDSDIGMWEQAIHPDDRERVLRSIHGAIEGDKARWSAAYRMRKADADYAYVYDRGFIIRDDDGLAVRAVGAVVDLTERRRAESELRRTQAELIHVSRVSAMGTMASTLAHELNQPLTAVTSYVRGSRRLLADSEDPSVRQVCEALEFAEAGALRAGQIVRRLRELVSRGAVAVGPEDLTRLIEDASVLAFVDEHLHGISHRIEIDPDARWVEADRIQIQQVLINLIRNAVQALQTEERREVVIRTRSTGEDTVEISVSDTGTGIASSVRDALFSPFHSTKDEGMGIGLSISRTIVEAHHGRIWAEDGPEGGTIFRFTLPRVDVPPVEFDDDEETAPSESRVV